MKAVTFAFAAAFALLSGPALALDGARLDGEERLRDFAGKRGCSLCHRMEPASWAADAATPLAPSWREIAARYRGDPASHDRLARIVIGGADPAELHWKDRIDFTAMRGNDRLTPDEARAVVRWILASP